MLQLAGAAVFASALLSPAHALDYPTRPVRLVVGFPPGGSADIVARLVAQALTERMGQTFIIDNKPGAGSNLGTETVARAEPDGYTLMADSVSNAINPTLYKKLNYDQLKDLIPVASIDVVPNVMDVNIDLPVKTVPEFIAYAKANPDKISMGSGGIGSSPHVAGELFKMTTGVNMLHIPYRGVALATADLLGGRMQVFGSRTRNRRWTKKRGGPKTLTEIKSCPTGDDYWESWAFCSSQPSAAWRRKQPHRQRAPTKQLRKQRILPLGRESKVGRGQSWMRQKSAGLRIRRNSPIARSNSESARK